MQKRHSTRQAIEMPSWRQCRCMSGPGCSCLKMRQEWTLAGPLPSARPGMPPAEELITRPAGVDPRLPLSPSGCVSVSISGRVKLESPPPSQRQGQDPALHQKPCSHPAARLNGISANGGPISWHAGQPCLGCPGELVAAAGGDCPCQGDPRTCGWERDGVLVPCRHTTHS